MDTATYNAFLRDSIGMLVSVTMNGLNLRKLTADICGLAMDGAMKIARNWVTIPKTALSSKFNSLCFNNNVFLFTKICS